jgi:hypothetical protein
MGVFIGGVATIGILAAILYLPLMLGSSWQAITDNRYISGGRPWHNLVDDFGILVYDLKYDFYYGVASIYLLGGGMILSPVLYFGRPLRGRFYRFAFGYLMAVLLALTVITLYKKIYPLERSLCFLVLVLNIFFVNVCYDAARRYFSLKGAMFVLCVFIGMKIAGSVRLLYWDRFALRNDERVRIYHSLQKDLAELSRLHPASWQITDSEDFYPDYVRLYLDGHGMHDRVVYSRKEALGEVIFLPDIYSPSPIPLEGYTCWAGNRRSEIASGILEEGYLTIYVSNRLLQGSGQGGR